MEKGRQYLGLMGQDSIAGCSKYKITLTEFTTDCVELEHVPVVSKKMRAARALRRAASEAARREQRL